MPRPSKGIEGSIGSRRSSLNLDAVVAMPVELWSQVSRIVSRPEALASEQFPGDLSGIHTF